MRKRLPALLFILVAVLGSLFADGPTTYTQEIILIAIVPPSSEVKQVISTDDTVAISNAIEDLYTDNGVVINLINMSPEVLDEVMVTCIQKIAEEINRGAFYEGSKAGVLIRTSSSQFKISQDGVAYTALDQQGQTEVRHIIKSLIEDYNIDHITYASSIVKVAH